MWPEFQSFWSNMAQRNGKLLGASRKGIKKESTKNFGKKSWALKSQKRKLYKMLAGQKTQIFWSFHTEVHLENRISAAIRERMPVFVENMQMIKMNRLLCLSSSILTGKIDDIWIFLETIILCKILKLGKIIQHKKRSFHIIISRIYFNCPSSVWKNLLNNCFSFNKF